MSIDELKRLVEDAFYGCSTATREYEYFKTLEDFYEGRGEERVAELKEYAKQYEQSQTKPNKTRATKATRLLLLQQEREKEREKKVERVKKFFSMKENKYCFEWADVSACLTILNVAFVVAGLWWAPLLGLANCGLAIVLNARGKTHLNSYLIQIALIVLNCYFLSL